MPFPLPTPEELTRRQEAYMEKSISDYAATKGLDVSPMAIARAVRSPRGILAAIVRNNAEMLYEAHLHLRWNGDQLFPDTAALENLRRHAATWGIIQRPATRAIGYATFTGAPDTVVPADTELRTPTGAMVRVNEAVTIDDARTALASIIAINAGGDGNTNAGAQLAMISPLLDLDNQFAVLDAGGLAGGAEIETADSLLERLLEKIQSPPHGGAAHDYPTWVQNVFPAARVHTLATWPEPGSVGVVVAMGTKAAPAVPTPAELEAIAAHLAVERPVTAEVIVLPVELVPVPLKITVNPDTTRTRLSVAAAVHTWFAREATIAGTLPRSRLSEAISSAAGEYSHHLDAPVVDLVAGDHQLFVPDDIEWGDA